jgi:hypothetical protein
MWATGCRLPTQERSGRSRCFCGAEIGVASVGEHVYAVHMHAPKSVVPQRWHHMRKMVPEYLERAHMFERLASHETDPKLRADFEKQALAYYKLAAHRAADAKVPPARPPKDGTGRS